MKRAVLLVSVFLLPPLFASALQNDYTPASVGAGAPELHINANGTISIRSGRVDQVLGTTLFLTARWGQMPMRFTMKTDGETRVAKRYGGAATVSQIRLGDYLDADGDFLVGSDFFGLNARRVKDWSLQEESETFSGTIVEVNPDTTLTLRTPLGKTIVVRQATTTSIRKGAVSLPWDRLRAGDSVPLADGVYDYATNTLTADQVAVFQPRAAFAARNYEGILKEVRSPRPPTALTVSVGGVLYTVHLGEKTPVQKKNRAPAELARFVVGDTVRFYGPLREEEKTLRDELIVDAEVIRNLNL